MIWLWKDSYNVFFFATKITILPHRREILQIPRWCFPRISNFSHLPPPTSFRKTKCLHFCNCSNVRNIFLRKHKLCTHFYFIEIRREQSPERSSAVRYSISQLPFNEVTKLIERSCTGIHKRYSKKVFYFVESHREMLYAWRIKPLNKRRAPFARKLTDVWKPMRLFYSPNEHKINVAFFTNDTTLMPLTVFYHFWLLS